MTNRQAKGSDAWPTGLMVIQGNQMEELRALMVQWMQRYPLRPLEAEQILVQSNGIAQWLQLALTEPVKADGSGGCGIAAGVQVQLPGRFVWQLWRRLLPDLPKISPWDKQPLTWRLMQLLSDLPALRQRLVQPDCLQPLDAFLAADPQPQRIYQLAGKLADLYDQYQMYRADWLEAWEAGQDLLISARGEQNSLPNGQVWQAAIWRCLKEDIAPEAISRASIHHTFLAKMAGLSQAPSGFPRRVLVFGLSSLPRQTLEVLQALAPFCQVILFVTNPSRYYWGDLIEGRELLRHEYRRQSHRDGRQPDLQHLHQYGHPLLASWGRQGRDYLHLLDELDQTEDYVRHFERIDLFNSPSQDSLLHQLQDDLLELRPLAERQARQSRIDPAQDHSLSFMVAHSPQREVEILQDQLLAAFEAAERAGQPLQPREILVMVPDINRYAPHIHAVFGRLARTDPRYLPYHLSDQGLRSHNPLLLALEKLLQLPLSRFTSVDLLDLLDVPALRERFGLQETDLPRLRQWIEGANIRWGLHAAQRESLQLPAGLEQNTWLLGLQRMLLGYAAGPAGAWQGIEPYDEVAGLDAALVGPLSLLVRQLDQQWQVQRQARSLVDWADWLHALLQDFFLPQTPADLRAIERVQSVLEQLQASWQEARLADLEVPLDVFRDSLLPQLDEQSLTQRFLAGSLNFATLMPMRAIPFRQIWLLGMNDGDYPRRVQPVDFDLMAGDYRPGDRSRREDDRYLFLEALLSARDRLVISWIGRSVHDNSEQPPSVLVSQLRDHLAAGWQAVQAGQSLPAALTTEFPLQAFSRRYFEAQRPATLFTYAHEWQQVRQSGISKASPPLPAWYPEQAISLQALVRFLKSPVDAFFQQRLKLPRSEELPVTPEVEPFVLDGLDTWNFRQQLLDEAFQPGLSEQAFKDQQQAFIERQQRSGALLEGEPGQLQAEDFLDSLPDLYQQWNQLATRYPNLLPLQPLRLQLTLDAGSVELEDLLSHLHEGREGRVQILLRASAATKDKHYQWRNLVEAWLRHLAAQVMPDSKPLQTWLLTPAGQVYFEPLTAEQAKTSLQTLLNLWWQGMQAPLPVALDASLGWLQALQKQAQPDLTLESPAWSATVRGLEADLKRSRYLQRCWPELAALQADGRFAQLSEALYGELLRAVSKKQGATE